MPLIPPVHPCRPSVLNPVTEQPKEIVLCLLKAAFVPRKCHLIKQGGGHWSKSSLLAESRPSQTNSWSSSSAVCSWDWDPRGRAKTKKKSKKASWDDAASYLSLFPRNKQYGINTVHDHRHRAGAPPSFIPASFRFTHHCCADVQSPSNHSSLRTHARFAHFLPRCNHISFRAASLMAPAGGSPPPRWACGTPVDWSERRAGLTRRPGWRRRGEGVTNTPADRGERLRTGERWQTAGCRGGMQRGRIQACLRLKDAS